MNTYNALAIANYFFLRARSTHVRDLSPVKMHALVYLAHGWHLGETGKPLIDGRVSANRDGVLLPDLREAGCWGTKAMSDFVSVLRMDEARGVMVEQKPMLPAGAAVTTLLDWVWKTYSKLTLFELTQQVTRPGGAWDLIWNDEERPDDEPKLIPVGTIRLWFQELKHGKRGSTTGRKLTDTQRRKLEKTQRILAKPDPDRIRSA